MAGNANSGRRPTPTALKVLRGTVRRDRLNPHEPKPPAGPVVKPSKLTRQAAQVWDRLEPLCLSMKTLTAADAAAFAVLCELVSMFEQVTTESPAAADIEAHRRAVREIAGALRPYLALFGLEPTSRARIRVPPEKPPSKWAGLLS